MAVFIAELIIFSLYITILIFKINFAPRNPRVYEKQMRRIMRLYETRDILTPSKKSVPTDTRSFSDLLLKEARIYSELYITVKLLVFFIAVASAAFSTVYPFNAIMNVIFRVCIALPITGLIFNTDLKRNRILFEIAYEAEKHDMDIINFINYYAKVYAAGTPDSQQ